MKKQQLGKVLTVVGWLMVISFVSSLINQFLYSKQDSYSPEPFSVHWIGGTLGKISFAALAVAAIYYGKSLQDRS